MNKYNVELPDNNVETEIQKLKEYIKCSYAFNEYGLWALEKKKSGNIIGKAGLFNSEYNGEKIVELGYMIKTDMQGKGYAYEAINQILFLVKEYFYINTIYCSILPENVKSIKLAEKLKFKLIGNKSLNDRNYFVFRLDL